MEKLPVLLIFVLVVSFTSSAYRNGRLSGADRTSEPQIQQCLLDVKCFVHLIMDPKCGSDGKSYPNRGWIDCLNRCLEPEEKVKIVSDGFCEADAIIR